MSPSAKKWTKFALRWGIAIAGIAIILGNISWYDRVLAVGVGGSDRPRVVRLAEAAPERVTATTELAFSDPSAGTGTVRGDQLVYKPDRKTVTLLDGQVKDLLALDLSDDSVAPQVRRLLVAAGAGPSEWVTPTQVAGGFELRVPSPLVERGVGTIVARADRRFLWAALAIFPVVFFITAYRWQQLLRGVEIALPFRRTFALNMVGSFYNSFMPGSTGGDLLKAYYAAKQTHHRTRAVMSVIVDRAIGLTALVLLGGSMAAFQWLTAENPNDAATRKSGQVAVGSVAILLAVGAGLTIFFVPALRKWSGLEFLLRRLPMQTQVKKATETMELYRRRPLLIAWAVAVTFPVHATVVTSAMLCGMAFDLPLPWWYYFVIVPVIVLSGSIPISPQGAGVMEFFAILLTRRQGCTIGEAFALTMSIRVVQMLWNLTGGFFVMKGGYHAPSAQEQQRLEEDEATAEPVEPVEPAR